MARIITAGNEMGEHGGDGFTVWRGAASDTAYSARGGARSPQNNGGDYYFTLPDNTGIEYVVTPQVPAGIDEFYLRMHVDAGARTDGTWELFRVRDDLDVVLFRFGGVNSNNGTTPGAPWYPAFFPATGISPFVSSTTYLLANDVWNLFEFYIKFDGTAGRIKLWVNNQLSIDWTGNLTGAGGETDMHKFQLHADQINGGIVNYRGYDNIALNDVTGPINNGRIGNGYILPMRPSGVGSSSQLTNSFGNTTDNFKFVNKPVSQNPSGFVGTNTPNDKDLYAVPSQPDEFRGVNAIRMSAYGVRNGPSITKAKFIVKPTAQAEIELPSGVGVGVALPTGTPGYFWQDFDGNSNNGGEPFSKPDIDGMEAGVQFIA